MYWEVWVFFHEPFKKSFSRFAEIPVEKFLDLFDVSSPLFLFPCKHIIVPQKTFVNIFLLTLGTFFIIIVIREEVQKWKSA